jgi:hypothetical protein
LPSLSGEASCFFERFLGDSWPDDEKLLFLHAITEERLTIVPPLTQKYVFKENSNEKRYPSFELPRGCVQRHVER